MRLGVFLLALFVLACGSGTELPQNRSDSFDGPIVLITLSGLRPDVVGALGASPAIWTPHLDAFAKQADWVGSSVTASSAPAVALVSLMTGVSPWHHQVLTHKPREPKTGIPLLAEALGKAGYRTTARVPLEYSLDEYGLLEGFENVAEVGSVDKAAPLTFEPLVEGPPEFFWFHLREANIAFERRDDVLPRLADRSATFASKGVAQKLPKKIQAWRLLSYADPRHPLPEDERALAWELFCHEVALADQQAGEILDALRENDLWDRSWIMITASQGMEFGEHSQALYAQNLGRKSVEVPLMIKLPQSLRDSIPIAEETHISQLRLWSTVVEAVGGRLLPLHAPSLFQAATPPILSELYNRDGVNEFSFLEGDLQLLWSSRFAPAEPEFYYAQLAAGGGRPPLSESSRRILGRLESAFQKSLPLSGSNIGTFPSLKLMRWTKTGVEPVEDLSRAQEQAIKLRRRWLRHVDRERSPIEESALSARLQ